MSRSATTRAGSWLHLLRSVLPMWQTDERMLPAGPRRVKIQSVCWGLLPGRHHQVPVEPYLQLGSFVQLEIGASEDVAAACTQAGSSGCADRRAFASACRGPSCGANSCADGSVGDDALLIRSFAGEFTLLPGGLDRGISGDSHHCRYQRDPSLTSFQLIHSQHHAGAGVTVFEGGDVAFDDPSSGHDQAAGCHQVFAKLGLEVLALLEIVRIERVFQLDDEPLALRDGIRRSGRSGNLPIFGLVGARAVFGTSFQHRIVLGVWGSVVLRGGAHSQRQRQSTKRRGPACMHDFHLMVAKEFKNAWTLRCELDPEKLLSGAQFPVPAGPGGLPKSLYKSVFFAQSYRHLFEGVSPGS